MLASLARRARVAELMDDPAVDPAEHRRALAGLARVNRLSRSAGTLWPPLARLAARAAGARVRVLDVATGGGDVPVSLARRARRAGLADLELHGCDVSPTAVRAAQEAAAAAGVPVRFFAHDVLADPLPGGYDAVTCSLFLHHLSEDEAVRVLRRMGEAAAGLVLVNDLERSRLGYALAWAGTRVLSRSPIVRFDGPASVRSAFTPREAVALADRAGLRGATVGRRWPCRFLLQWRRPR